MRKLCILLGLSSLSNFVFAVNSAESTVVSSEYQAFQQFDNQLNIGYGATYGNLTNFYGQNANYGTTMVNIGIERLFDIGIWGKIDASLMTGYSNFNSSNPNALTGPLGQDPSVGNINLKIGYAFPLIKNSLLLTPYGLIGRNTNLTSNSLNNNQGSANGVNILTTNVTADYFLTTGFGGRLEYRINNVFDLYFDQNALYNSDRSGPNSQYTSATNYQLVSTVGAKFNVWKNLQLGLQGFYTYTQLSGAINTSATQPYQLYQQNQVGGLASIGITY